MNRVRSGLVLRSTKTMAEHAMLQLAMRIGRRRA